MRNDKNLPKRKSARLKNFNYGSAGAYFVTICIQNKMHILSEIVEDCVVGEGLAPPEIEIKLKSCGEIVREQLQSIETRFPTVTVEDYVIMPDHLHAIIFLHEEAKEESLKDAAGGASPSHTLNDVISAFKSLTSRICKQKYGIEKMFQRSYVDHVIRDENDYETRKKYIYENPIRWYCKKSDVEI